MSENERVHTPLGFSVQETGDGKFALAVTGGSTWYMTGFACPSDIHEWVMDYLATMSDNVTRINVELAERQQALQREQELKRIEILAQYPTSGKPS